MRIGSCDGATGAHRPGLPPVPLPRLWQAVQRALRHPGMSMQGMTDAQKAYKEAMNKMHPPMMTAIQAKDPDVAFICGMLPHHQGAIDMARAELKYGDNPEAKRMAEKVIKDQGEEIEKMTAWLKKNAKKEGQ